MNWIIDNWFVIFALLVVVIAGIFACIRFACLPTEAQKDKVKEWLKYAVTEAEKALKGGTGALKLRMVYDMFVSRFPWVSRVITFTTFSIWVDDALVWLRTQIDCNKNIQGYVKEE